MDIVNLPASFRDPSGFVFESNGKIFRQINRCYAEQYDFLISSGLYEQLTSRKMIVPHREVNSDESFQNVGVDCYKIIEPERVPYVSYPYEWCFSQLKDAALLTLSIQKEALEHGLILKDASAYNVQFIGGRPIFIDTLSFERYRPGETWIAYRQFCQHFLGPLALMSFSDSRLRNLLRCYIDGLPLDLVSRLLPKKTFLKYSFLAHIHLHALSQKRHLDDARLPDEKRKPMTMSVQKLLALAESLQNAVRKCTPLDFNTEWGDYYEDTNYTSHSMSTKEQLVGQFVDTYIDASETIHDIGGNTGKFSRLIANPARIVLSHDIDELAVERNYLFNKKSGVSNVLPLVLDLCNASPGLGWGLNERDSTFQRINGEVVLALALIHHIVISNNVPIGDAANILSRMARKLIIEFVPKEDSQVRRLLSTRQDIFPNYNLEFFEKEFQQHFRILEKKSIEGSKRTLFFMERRW